MTHRWLSRALSAYLDGELPGWEGMAVVQHLRRCAACRERLEAVRGVRLAVRAARGSTPPADGWARLRRQLTAMPRGRRPVSRPGLRWAAAALVAGLMAAFGGSLWLGIGDAPPPVHRTGESLLAVQDLIEEEAIPLSPSIELVLAAREPDGAGGEAEP